MTPYWRGIFRLLLLSLLGAALLPPLPAGATEFVIVGPRAAGMGGAGVAVTTDSLATYWNPAGLALSSDSDVRLQASGQGVDRLGIRQTLEDIDAIDTGDLSAGNQARLQALLNRLNGSSISAMGAAGLYVKRGGEQFAVGVNVSDVATGGLFTPTPLSASISGTSLAVTGQLRADALEARQVAVSTAYASRDRTVAIGVTGKLIQGAAYSNTVEVLTADDSFDISGDLGEPDISHEIGLDVGVMLMPTSWLRVGVVGKDLNEPTFDAPGGGEFQLNPQARGGVALVPSRFFTLAFDADITANRTFVPGLKSRVLSLGAELEPLPEVLALRVGALKNVEDAESIVTPTAGLALRLLAVQLDLAAGYDFDEGGALASFALGAIF